MASQDFQGWGYVTYSPCKMCGVDVILMMRLTPRVGGIDWEYGFISRTSMAMVV